MEEHQSLQENTCTSVSAACLSVLCTANAREKATAALSVAMSWKQGKLNVNLETAKDLGPPDRPNRPSRPELRTPRDMPKRGLGSSHGKLALLHALAHIELNAIDLAFDMVARYLKDCWDLGLDADVFVEDWLGVGKDEARHFLLLDDRMRQLGSKYGDLPAHDGLWEAAIDTKDDWAARLAVVPMVLEARGLDVSPNTVKSLKSAGDDTSADILQTIYEEEIRHVEIGTSWFKRVCTRKKVDEISTYHQLVREYFSGTLKPPFNDKARQQAGLLPNFYRPLAQ